MRRNGVHVLHVVHTFGLPSQTFLRTTVDRPRTERDVVVCRFHGPLDWSDSADRVVTVGGFLDRVPAVVRGKTSVAVVSVLAQIERVDVVHAHFAHEIELAHRVASLRRCPLVISLHGRDLLVELRDDERFRIIERADAIVVPSAFLAERLGSDRIDPARVWVIGSGVDLGTFAAAAAAHIGRDVPNRRDRTNEVLRVLFVGRFVDKKAPLDTIAAITRAGASGVRIEATLFGSGPLEDHVRRAAADAAVPITVASGDNRSRVVEAFAHHDVVLSPSRTAPDGDAETLLLVNLEAQAAGLPVVTTRSGGIEYGLGPGAAILVDEGAIDDMADALAILAGDPARREAMGRAGREWVREHGTAEGQARALERLYAKVCKP